MKKIIAFLLVAIMAVFLVACGGNNTTDPDNKNNPSQSQSGDNNAFKTDNDTSSKTDSYDLTTVEGYIGQFGYSADDFKFTKDFTRVGYASRAAKDGVMYVCEAAVFQSAKKSAEEKQAWLEGFVDLAKTKADDGKVYGYDIANGISSEEYIAQYDPEAYTFLTRMSYKQDNKTVIVTIDYHNGLDNEDEDEADYLVGIEFKFEKTY